MKTKNIATWIAITLLTAGTALAQSGPARRNGGGYGTPPKTDEQRTARQAERQQANQNNRANRGNRAGQGQNRGRGQGWGWGICDGTGQGRGQRNGPRDGSGPRGGTPNCPANN